MPLSKFHTNVLAVERKKLQAVQEKIPKALEARDWAKMTGLAQSAERIAARLVIMLDQVNRLGE